MQWMKTLGGCRNCNKSACRKASRINDYIPVKNGSKPCPVLSSLRFARKKVKFPLSKQIFSETPHLPIVCSKAIHSISMQSLLTFSIDKGIPRELLT